MIAIRDHPLAAAAMGVDTALYKSLTFGVSADVRRHCRRAGRVAIGLCLAGQLPRLPFDQIPGRQRRRRHRLDFGCLHRGTLHRVYAQFRTIRYRRRRPMSIFGMFLIAFDVSHAEAGRRRPRLHPASSFGEWLDRKSHEPKRSRDFRAKEVVGTVCPPNALAFCLRYSA